MGLPEDDPGVAIPLPELERIRSRTHLHETLKRLYSDEGGMECAVGDFFVDGRRGDQLVEVQTRNLAGLRPKVLRLLADGHRVLVVHPVALEKTIVRLARSGGAVLGRRRSPKRGRWTEAFAELVYLKEALAHPALEVQVVLTREEERRLPPGRRGRVRLDDRRLEEVLGVRIFQGPADWRRILPEGLPGRFGSAALARAMGEPRSRAQAVLYVLAAAGAVRRVARSRGGVMYERTGDAGEQDRGS
jgi:hypothetical protein